ncbi:hypothetical protein CQW23_08978 [Capsicum baccatum]|uniref:Uncharacterized protein n=1 Tax=Capsicum baccatum TaxID=33114 RepID=A0A2G2XAI6_CAPBA|nr:hypothetical protein CQW23_08978 [Capsicum baccatum]
MRFWGVTETLKKALANKEALTPQTNKPKEASRTTFQKPKATAELQEGYDVTKLYDQAGNDSFMKTPPSPPFAFRSQDTPQTPASGLKYQQAPRSPNSGFKSQQPPRSPTSGFKSQQPPWSPTSALKSCNAPRSPTSAAIQSQKPLTSSTHGKGSQIRRSLRTIGKLINGSDRKNQQKRTEAAAPLSPFSCQNEEKSSTASNERTLRRQSLTGIPLPTMSRRSSLGGGSVPDSYAGPSTKLMVPPLENVELSQPVLTTEVEALVRPLQHVASNFEPQLAISTSNLFLFLECGVPCVNVLHNSLPSPRKVREGVDLILKGLRDVNIISL